MSYLDNNLDKLFNYVKNLLITNGKKLGCSDEVFEHIVESIVLDLIRESKNNDKKYDDVVLVKFNDYLKKVSIGIQEYIRNVLYKEVDLLTDVSMKTTVEKITRDVIFTGDVSYFNLMNGRLDDYIIKLASSSKKSSDMKDAKKYVIEKIKEVSDLKLTDKEISEIGSLITTKLHEEYGYSYKDILAGSYDSIIFRLFYRSVMANSSVQKENVPKEIKHNTKKKRMPSQVISLLLTAVVTISTLTGVGILLGKGVHELRFGEAYSDVIHFEDYKYDAIYALDNERVEPTAINALKFYDKINDTGLDTNVYGYLGFYNAYYNVRQDKLHVMDEILRLAKKECVKSGEYSEVYDVIRDDDCFLEFAMDRLYDMGYEKIKDEKYTAVLKAYIDAKNKLDGGIVMNSDELTDEQKDIVEDIMSMYRKYSKNSMIDLDKLLDEYGFYDTLSNSSGRKI